MGGLIREEAKDERLQRLQALLNQQMRDFNEQTIGKEVPVLFDGYNADKGQLHGRTAYNQAIHLKGNERLNNNIEMVKITGTNGKSLMGDIVII